MRDLAKLSGGRKRHHGRGCDLRQWAEGSVGGRHDYQDHRQSTQLFPGYFANFFLKLSLKFFELSRKFDFLGFCHEVRLFNYLLKVEKLGLVE